MALRVLLIRHGEASDPHVRVDGSRHLTVRGREVTAQVAEALRARGLVPTHVYTSPLVRAVQTAEIVVHAMGLPGPVVTHDPLEPDGATAHALAVLERHGPGPDGAAPLVALVTHEPIVRRMAAHLAGEPDFPSFRTSGAALVELDEEGRGSLLGRLDPSTMAWRPGDDLGP
jgi:phosphohistidine phosphatase